MDSDKIKIISPQVNATKENTLHMIIYIKE